MSQIREYQFINGPESATTPSPGTPLNPDDLINKGFADKNYMQGSASVTTITGLKNVLESDRKAGDTRFLDETNGVYAFNGASSLTNDDYFVIQPTVGAGRWLRVTDFTNQGDLRIPKELTLAEIATPATPSSDNVKIYPKSDGKLYKLASDGIEESIGDGGSGSGEINLIADPSTADNWLTNGTFVAATTTTEAELPLSGAVTTALKLSAGAATDYTYYRFSMAESLKNTLLKIEWFQRTLSSYASGDMKVELYTNTASDYSGSYVEVPLQDDVSGDSFIPNANGNYKNTFVSNNLDFYELRIIRVANSSALALSNVIVGPGKLASGAIITEWENYTPTFRNATGLTISTNISRYRRVGSVMEIDMRLGFSGTGTDTAFFGIDYPPGLSAQNQVLLNVSTSQVFGLGYFRDASANTNTVFRITTQTFDPTVFVLYPPAGSSALFGSNIAVSDAISFQARVPIAEWQGNGVVNLGENDVEYAWNFSTTLGSTPNTTSLGYGPQGTLVPTGASGVTSLKDVAFRSPILPTDSITLEVSADRISWMQLDLEPVGGVHSFTRQGAVEYGLGLNRSTTPNRVQARFGPYRLPGTTYTGAGSNWIGGTYWRVKKTRAGSATGFGVAQNGSTGLVQYKEQTFNSVSSGNITNGTIKVIRVNNLVTLHFSNMTHGSTETPNTVDLFLPVEFRPVIANASVVYTNQAAEIRVVVVSLLGQVAWTYRNYSGVLTSRTSTGSGSISYTV